MVRANDGDEEGGERIENVMNVLVVSVFPPDPAPEANHALHLSEQLAKAGQTVQVLCKKGSIASTQHGMVTHPVINDWSWSDLPRLAKCLKSCQPDVVLLLYIGWVYNHNSMITFLPTICKTILPGVPCVTQFEIVDTELPHRSFGGRALRKAMALKHPDELVLPSLAQAMLAQGQYKKLTEEFSQSELKQATAQANLKTSLASAQAAQGKTDLSQAALKAALLVDPGYLPALIFQAREKAKQRDFDGALVSLDSIIAGATANQEAWKLKGDVLLYGNGKVDEALQAYRKSVEVKADYADGHVAILITLMRQGNLGEAAKQLELLRTTFPNGAQTRYFDTLLAYQKKDFKRARELSQQMIKMAPDNLLSLLLAASVELQVNSLAQAEVYLTKVLQAAPEALLARRLLATTYLSASQPGKAIAALLPGLKGENIDAATNSIAGEAYMQNGDSAKAEEFFTKAAKQDPKDIRARTSLALAHLASGRGDAALTELQDIASSDTGIAADLALISAQLSRKEFDKALKAIDALEKKQPDKPLAANLQGRTLLAKRDSAGARKSFERSVAIDQAYFPSIAGLAAMDMAEQKPEEARKRFEAVVAKDPKNGPALLALAGLRATMGGAKDEVAELITRAVTANPDAKAPRLLLIDAHLRNKDFKLAVSAAQNAVAAIPDSPELLDALGRAQQASGEMNQALATYIKVAAMQPLSPTPQMRLADAYVIAKNPDAAAQSLRKALDIKPDMLEAQRDLIVLAMAAKNFDEAVRIARSIQKQRPKEVDGYKFEGDIAASQRRWNVAVDAYRAGLKQVPSPVLAAKLYSALGSAGNTAELEKFTAAWLKDNPRDVAFRLYLADSSAALRDYAGAEKMYFNVTQIQPNNAAAFNNLAWVSAQLKKEGAIGYAEKAVALAPNQPAYIDTLALLLYDKNDYSKAVEWQNKAIALQPQNGLYRLNLAKIYIKGGKKDFARKELDELAKLGTKFAAQAEVATLLKSL